MSAFRDEAEAKLIERLRVRDERAFNELVRTYGQRVFLLVYRMIGRRDEAEDLAQEVFVQVFKAIGEFRGDAKLSTWMFRIAVNLSKNRSKYLSRRRDGRHDELDGGGDLGDLTDKGAVGLPARPDELLTGRQLEAVVNRAIAELDPDFREVLVLRDVEELSYEQICEITGLAEGTVKSRIHRARRDLKEAVERALGEKIA